MSQQNKMQNFDTVQLKLASPEDILSWSYGEVTRPETINYRTQRSEKGGLFDEKIFGPEKDYECYCGKYKGVRYRGIVCEKCGVEITRSVVRRSRMGHIELASPVSHIWYLRSIPSRIGLIMGIQASELEKVVYFGGYIVHNINEDERKNILAKLDKEYKDKVKQLEKDSDIDNLKELLTKVKKEVTGLREGDVLDEITHSRYEVKYPGLFKSGIGAEAVYNLVKEINMPKLLKQLEKRLPDASAVERPKLVKRINLLTQLIAANLRPEWMFLTHLPITPPALRPMVPLGGGRHATSDVNDLYRRVINRNNRLKKLMNIGAPDVILRNEKRILQEAIDALIDNNMRSGGSQALSSAQKRPLKSLSENLKGKSGIFRQNLLGKRVDYSGRSVIVVGPELDMDECGLPKKMALELFRPFVVSKLLEQEYAHNIKLANRLIDEGEDYVWALLEEVMEGKYVMLNRAPTLHKLGLQAFRPQLAEGKSIQIHPSVCAAFNADFDGDTMAVHLPLSAEAQAEAREIMASDKNVLKPGNGELIVNSKLDIVLGTYWATKMISGAKGEGKCFSSPNDAINSWDYGITDFRAKIKVLGTDTPKYSSYDGQVFETTVGRLLFNSYLPSDYPFVNGLMDKKGIGKLENELIAFYGIAKIPKILDSIKNFGFKYATVSGITWSNDDVVIPESKAGLIEEGNKRVKEVWGQYETGLISQAERRRKNVEIWMDIKSQVEDAIPKAMNENSSVSDMTNSGARGSKGNLSTMAGMKGIVNDVTNESIEFPVKSSTKEGLDPIEYFITTHGSRKGLADTALNTAKAGYLTRRLFDVCQDMIVREKDCKTKDSITIARTTSGIQIPLSKNIRGRHLAEAITGPKGKMLYEAGHFVTIKDAMDIEALDHIELVKVFSPITCKTLNGVCQKCYGMDMGSDQIVDMGETVGTIAAQAIGEPGTQLTMRTFHAAGAASQAGDITQGLPRVEEIFERRKPKVPAVLAKADGEIIAIEDDGTKKLITVLEEPSGTSKGSQETVYKIPFLRTPTVEIGDKLKRGDFMTDGSANLEELLELAGRQTTENYIIAETVAIYELQGSSVSRKHIEVVIKQMFSRSRISEIGDSSFIVGEVVENSTLNEVNALLKKEGKTQAKANLMVLGITEVSLSRDSFLSAASFQHTVRILIDSSLKGAKDHLKGLKENVIIGRLIPAGSGHSESQKYKMIARVQEEVAQEEEARRAEEEALEAEREAARVSEDSEIG
ncbi:MAG: DNA-directed RNA polymerase subunit beta' [Patescibacteria group bacterium]